MPGLHNEGMRNYDIILMCACVLIGRGARSNGLLGVEVSRKGGGLAMKLAIIDIYNV